MDGTEFEKNLAECRESLAELSGRSKELTERICRLLEEFDGESGDVRWSCRTMVSDIEDVLSDVDKRLGRFRDGDRRELPSVMFLALDCCERLQDTAQLFREGRESERRDLKGQMTSNLGYLAHHISAMKEDGYVPEDAEVFSELDAICTKVFSGSAELEELRGFICEKLDPVHDYLKKIRKEQFWEESEEE